MFEKHQSRFGAATGILRSPNLRAGGVLLILALLALEAGGCGWFRPVEWPEMGQPSERRASPFKVVPQKSTQVAALTPDDIVRIMQRIGFADEQVLELGTDLHNALRSAGAATVTYKKRPIAAFMVEGDYVLIRTSSGGSFNYQISTGQFGSAGPQIR